MRRDPSVASLHQDDTPVVILSAAKDLGTRNQTYAGLNSLSSIADVSILGSASDVEIPPRHIAIPEKLSNVPAQ
jgi:hypothetical protein